MSFLIQALQTAMWAGIFLSLVVFLPYPRFIRKPILIGLEKILSNKIVVRAYETLIVLILFLFYNSYRDMKHYQLKILELKAQINSNLISGLNRIEIERSIEQNKVLMFTEQRNIYLNLFVLVLFFVVLTYILSLKRDEAIHDELIQLKKVQKLEKQSSSTPTDLPNDSKFKHD